MVRLKDIAEVCGVSVATVSRALNGLTNENRERTAYILRTAKEMGYYPNVAARTLKPSRSNTIGVLYENVMTHEYFSSVLEALRRQADMRGYDLMMIGDWRGDKSGNYFEHVRRRNLDGVAVISADFDSSNVIRLVTSAIPSVIIDHFYEGCDCVSSDNRASMERIVRYAWSQGHRRIAMIHGEIGSVSRERLAGFYKGCAELGIRVPEGFVREGNFHDPEGCARIVADLLQGEEKPTVILCQDDFSCLGALLGLRTAGIRVPEDVSLVGFDGIRIARLLEPRLVTYRQDAEQMGSEAARLLIEQIENPDTWLPRQITAEGQLLEGSTVSDIG